MSSIFSVHRNRRCRIAARQLGSDFVNEWQTSNRNHCRVAAEPAACAKLLMLSTLERKGKREGRREERWKEGGNEGGEAGRGGRRLTCLISCECVHCVAFRWRKTTILGNVWHLGLPYQPAFTNDGQIRCARADPRNTYTPNVVCCCNRRLFLITMLYIIPLLYCNWCSRAIM